MKGCGNMNNWIDDYLIDWHTGNELKIYRDFEVISFIGIKQPSIHTVECLLNVNLHEIVKYQTATETLNELIKLIPKDEDIYITTTPIHHDLSTTYFYKLSLPLRIDYAIQVGLGVARSVNNYKEYCLYPIAEEFSQSEVEKRTIDLWRLKLYAQLILGDENIDPLLKEAWQTHKGQLRQLIFADVDQVESTFDNWFLVR